MNRIWQKKYDPGVRTTLNYPQVPVHYFLTESAKRYPDRICIINDDLNLSYQEVDQLSTQVASGLMQLGLAKGDRVAIMMPNCPQFVIYISVH